MLSFLLWCILLVLCWPLALVALVYRWVIRWQGDWLTAREQKILEVVTSRAE